MTISMLLDMAASAFGDRIALGSVADGMTFAGLARTVAGGAAVLRGENARSVAFVGLNSPALPVLLFTAAAAGLPVAPLNYRLDAATLRKLLDRLDQPLVVADPAFAEIVTDSGSKVMTTPQWLAAAGAAAAAPGFDPSGTGAADDVAADSTGADDTAADSTGAENTGPAVLLFTSGTTAEPKCVVLRHSHLLSYVLATVEFGAAATADCALVSVPPYHVAAVGSALSSIYAGRRVTYLPDFTPQGWLATVREDGVTSAMVVPTMLARIVEYLDGAPADCPSLVSLAYGGARMPASLLAAALRSFPATGFVNAYGLTETSSTITVLTPEDHRSALESADPQIRARLSSAGRPVPGMQAEVRAPDGSVLPPGVAGELWVRGAQVSGEYRDHGSVLDDAGWFPTRDRARIDSGGYVFLEGRADDTIIRGGENISPAEVEEVLLSHPAVRDAVIVGVPDEEWGERMVAVVVPAAATPATSEALRAHVRERLRGSRTPDEVIFRAELPTTPLGKVMRRELTAELSAARAAQAGGPSL
jgi:acyl-CoA synthetase (AMP-forming)/AMP-acid ligase II